MSTSTLVCDRPRAAVWVRLGDYLELTKPKIAALELVTVAVAGCLAGWPSPAARPLAHALLGTALVAASASALNQWLERHRDACMERTCQRPLPAGRLSSLEVLVFGGLTGVLGIGYLALAVNLPTALLGALSWLLYVAVYTPMKARSPINTVVGAVAGAVPILMGWTAVGGRLNLAAATLFLIVYLWQFPHFMAIAWIYRHQYAQAGMQMLSVVDPTGRRAGVQAVCSALALVPVSLVPAVVSFAGPTYFAWALALGLGQAVCAVLFWRRPSETSARVLLRASLVYLPTLLMMMLLGPFV
ncbi:MAG TPA: heme o synthase [Pirellulales bacterium]|jgi:protoheme IX farnesyltransferase|nr:heme o synthase [Pirellulales bacterium]